MFGHGLPPGVLDFCAGACFAPEVEVGVEPVAVDCVDGAFVAAVLCVVGDADALAMPAAVPAVASAPATIVAPSIFEMVIGSNLLGLLAGVRPSCATLLSGKAGVRRGSVSTG
jgi:hypothetical protein